MQCMQRLYESIMNICSEYGTQTYFKGNKTLKNILVTPKDKAQLQQKRVKYTGIGA